MTQTNDNDNRGFVGWLPGAARKQASVTSDWSPLGSTIEDVVRVEAKTVPASNGAVRELFRADWDLRNTTVDQVFERVLFPGVTSAWHVHEKTTDRLVVHRGHLRIVLFDARDGSSTNGRINEFFLAEDRPTLVVVPPGVWHGIHNPTSRDAGLLNIVDRAYIYDEPDHWELPPDTDCIPYKF